MPVVRQLAGHHALELGAHACAAPAASARRAGRRRRALPTSRQRSSELLRHGERRLVPAQRRLRAGGLLPRRAARRAPPAVPALVGAPRPMMVRQAISVGFFERIAKRQRRGDLRRVVAVDPLRRPAVGGEALQHVVGVGQRGVAVDRDVVVVVQHRQLVEPQMAGQRRSPRG